MMAQKISIAFGLVLIISAIISINKNLAQSVDKISMINYIFISIGVFLAGLSLFCIFKYEVFSPKVFIYVSIFSSIVLCSLSILQLYYIEHDRKNQGVNYQQLKNVSYFVFCTSCVMGIYLMYILFGTTDENKKFEIGTPNKKVLEYQKKIMEAKRLQEDTINKARKYLKEKKQREIDFRKKNVQKTKHINPSSTEYSDQEVGRLRKQYEYVKQRNEEARIHSDMADLLESPTDIHSDMADLLESPTDIHSDMADLLESPVDIHPEDNPEYSQSELDELYEEFDRIK